MANSTQMALKIAEIFGVSLVSTEVVSRVLMEHGLRKNGGRGRGALPMDAIDFFHVSLGIAGGVAMKEAPAFIRAVTDLKLLDGAVCVDEIELWHASTQSEGLLAILNNVMAEQLDGVKIFPSLGPFIAGWIEGLAENQLPHGNKGRASLEISHADITAPIAVFKFFDDEYDISLKFMPDDLSEKECPDWERKTVFHDRVIRKLSAAYRSEK